MGVKPGDHVAIWATNVPQWYITFWATTKIGAVLVTVNTAYKIHEAEYLLRQSDTHTLVMIDGYKDSDYVGIIKELCPELAGQPSRAHRCTAKRLPFLRNVITVDFQQKGCCTWEEAHGPGRAGARGGGLAPAAARCASTTCATCSTPPAPRASPRASCSPTTTWSTTASAIGDCMDLSTADRMMIQVPMFHCFGMVLAMTASMTHGAAMCPIAVFLARKRRCTASTRSRSPPSTACPPCSSPCWSIEDFEKTDFSYMRTGIMAGSPCPIKVMQDVVDKMHMNEITIVYGQTEASPGCTMSHAPTTRWRSA